MFLLDRADHVGEQGPQGDDPVLGAEPALRVAEPVDERGDALGPRGGGRRGAVQDAEDEFDDEGLEFLAVLDRPGSPSRSITARAAAASRSGVRERGRGMTARPRAWGPVLRALAHSTVELLRGRAKAPSFFPDGGRYGLPADFLIAQDGRVLAAGYGEHVDDQWPVERLLALAEEAGAGRA